MSTEIAFSVEQARAARLLFAGAAHVDRSGWLDAPAEAERSNPGQFDERVGGAAFNVASITAALGSRPELATLLGNDSAGSMVREIAASRAVTLHAQTIADAATASYTSIIEPDGTLNIGLADMGIYDRFRAGTVDTLKSSLSETDWICVDANLPKREIEALLNNANCKLVGLTVSAAKAPRLRTIAERLDLLFTNRAEALALCGGESHADAKTAAEQVQALGVNHAVISDGPDNVQLVDEGGISALPVSSLADISDVTGAGDALAGATLFALLGGAKLVEAAEFGICAAQAILNVYGPWREDLAERLGIVTDRNFQE